MTRKPDPSMDGKRGFHQPGATDSGSFEVFFVNASFNENRLPDDELPIGWYWWPCFPGCLPDGDATGPFVSSRAAWLDARRV